MKKKSSLLLNQKSNHNTPSIQTTPLLLSGVVFFVALVTLLFYLPAITNGFVNWDDADTIIENTYIRSFDFSSLYWMWTSFHTGNWIPLTWFSFALDYAIDGLNSKVYHFHNVFLHTINTILVFFVSLKILKLISETDDSVKKAFEGFSQPSKEKKHRTIPLMVWTSALTALLFGLHPIHVESVAWVTERKDLLFSLFFFAALLFYLDYVSSKKNKLQKWLICLGLFVLSLLSKPMAISFPVVLLLLDLWPLGRLKRDCPNMRGVLWEKIPFFLLSFAMTIVTFFAQSQAGAVSDMKEVTLGFRFMNAFHSLIFYIEKMVVPLNLTALYPLGHQGSSALSPANILAVSAVFCISLICYLHREKRPYLMISWLYYLVTLIPVLGILQVGSQAAADRYTYLPCLSLFLLFSSCLVLLLSPRRKVLATLSSCLVLAIGVTTIRQIAVWENSITLWQRVVTVYPNFSVVAHTNMGNAYKQFGKLELALEHYNHALALAPHPYIYDGRGTVLMESGFIDEAIEEFEQALALDPHYPSPYRNLWFAYFKKEQHDKALEVIQEAIRLKPDFTEAYNELGISYGIKGKNQESIEAFKKALSRDAFNSKYLVNLATTYQRNGQLDEAIELYKRGLRLNPKESIYFVNLANTYLLKGLLKEAVNALQAAVDLSPKPEIFQKLALIYEKMGDKEKALKNYQMVTHFKN